MMTRQLTWAAALLVAGLAGWQAQAASESGNGKHAPDDPSLAVATFAGGCFWCVEAGFEKIPGVEEAVSGYSGGSEKDPTYEQVSAGRTNHTEAVQVYYDPDVITYKGLLEGFWRMMDPTDNQGQFVDRGKQYRPAIFYHNAEQKRLAEASLQELKEADRYQNPVVMPIEPFGSFYVAEDYHQDYYKENPVRYNVYTFNSGRYQFIDKVWGEDREIDYANYHPSQFENPDQVDGVAADTQAAAPKGVQGFDPAAFRKPTEDELRSRLSPVQFDITQRDGTEKPFANPYWDEKRVGLYVDVVSGEPLFSSSDKYRSGTGWPSFVRPIADAAVTTHEDRSWFGVRTEVRSVYADSHLGHVFSDGPAPTRLRYCMNSAALKFIPREDMAAAGYGEFLDRVGEPLS